MTPRVRALTSVPVQTSTVIGNTFLANSVHGNYLKKVVPLNQRSQSPRVGKWVKWQESVGIVTPDPCPSRKRIGARENKTIVDVS